MSHEDAPPGSKDKVLFTPGPLTTSRTVKQAMLRDLGSRDFEFIGVIAEIRRRLVELGGAREDDYVCVLLQGSGSFGLEAVVSSTLPPDGKLLVVVNGAYGRRVAEMARRLRVPVACLEYPENRAPAAADVARALAEDREIAQVSMCSCETTSGILNPVREVGEAVAAAGRSYFVDAMSTFGAVPLDLARCQVDYLVSSANKCIEGVPGFSFVLARREKLLATEGWARSLCLDLLDQLRGFEANGQFRFTPPTHALLAFRRALDELDLEGDVEGRGRRYRRNHETLVGGMRALGFREYLDRELQGPVITSFLSPDHLEWDFDRFYDLLNRDGYVIYPGKVGDADCFRIGTVGRIFESDVRDLLAAIERVLTEMGVQLKP